MKGCKSARAVSTKIFRNALRSLRLLAIDSKMMIPISEMDSAPPPIQTTVSKGVQSYWRTRVAATSIRISAQSDAAIEDFGSGVINALL